MTYAPPTNPYVSSPTGGYRDQPVPREDGFAGITDGQNFDWGNAYNTGMNAIQTGAQAYGQGAAATDQFSVDPWAGYKGSFQGLASGGVVGAIAGGVGAQLGTFSQVNR